MDDFIPVNDVMITFVPTGATEENVTVTTLTDPRAEGDETLRLEITGVSGCATMGMPSVAIVTIDDDDGKSVVVYVK